MKYQQSCNHQNEGILGPRPSFLGKAPPGAAAAVVAVVVVVVVVMGMGLRERGKGATGSGRGGILRELLQKDYIINHHCNHYNHRR